MFAAPEMNDDAAVSSTTMETKKLTTQPEGTTEILSTVPPPATSETPVTTTTTTTNTENDEKNSIKTEVPSTSSSGKQHLSRLSLFQRNTIHVCDQISDHILPHQQHHSAPPTHHQTSKTGLDAIHENAEDTSTNEQQQQQDKQNLTTNRFPRSSTVPYPAYATVRQTTGNQFPPYPCYYSDNGTLIPGTVSPAQLNAYYHSRQPFSIINTNFQPISPHHQLYSRPVDILKPTFLIVPKAAEQRLSAQLSASNSPTSTIRTKTSPTKSPTKKRDHKSPQKSATSHSVERQSNSQSPTKTTMDLDSKHIGLVATPNPSPYVHFVSKTHSIQQSQDGLPETSIIQENFPTSIEYNQTSASIRSMPNISLTQVSPQHLYGSPNLRYYSTAAQQPPPPDEQEQQQQQQVTTNSESTNVRSATAPQMGQTTNGRTRIETDESSVHSIDFVQTDFVEMPGSWRFQPVPLRAVPRRYRAPIPQSFLDQQQYASDSEQVVRPSSYRQQQLFGSIPTINQPFDSIRGTLPIQFSSAMRLDDKDILKIASFYKSMGTLVYVARSLATLYASDFDAMANLKDWKKLYTGVPIWLFNTGMNPKRARCIRLIIAELGSSFTLWDTIVNGASDVRLPKARHITLKSLETGAILALKFDDTTATDEFHQYFVKLSCDPRNADLFDIFNAKRRRPVFILRKKKIRKSAISKPSQFNHITKVDEHDRDSLYTFSVLVDEGPILSS